MLICLYKKIANKYHANLNYESKVRGLMYICKWLNILYIYI